VIPNEAFMIETRLVLAYSPARLRPIFVGILALDAKLGQIVAQARDPHLARIRLAWWDEQLGGLTDNSAPADPDLHFAATLVRHHDVTPAMVTRLTQGWDVLLRDDGITTGDLKRFGELRGGTLFSMAAQVAGCAPPSCAEIGAGWALTDFAFRCSTPETARRAADEARALFTAHSPRQMRRALPSFALLAHFAQLDLRQSIEEPRKIGSPWRAFQALLFAMGRRSD
jgi:15-cis-phytoene synthase